MDPTFKYFLLGTVGALAPEIIRLYSIARSRGRFTWSWFYIIISFVFAGLGGLVAALLPSENGRAAFYAGISTPVIVSTAAKRLRSRQVQKKKLKGVAERVESPLSRMDSFLNAL